jgi:hypothetical protein
VENNISSINGMLMEMKKDAIQKISDSNGSRLTFDLQRKTLENLFADMKSSLQVQNMQSTEALARATEALHSQIEARILDSVNKSNSASYKSFHTRACEIDEKVKDIRSLILRQAIPKSSRDIPKPVEQSQISKVADYANRLDEKTGITNGSFYIGIFVFMVGYFLISKMS